MIKTTTLDMDEIMAEAKKSGLVQSGINAGMPLAVPKPAPRRTHINGKPIMDADTGKPLAMETTGDSKKRPREEPEEPEEADDEVKVVAESPKVKAKKTPKKRKTGPKVAVLEEVPRPPGETKQQCRNGCEAKFDVYTYFEEKGKSSKLVIKLKCGECRTEYHVDTDKEQAIRAHQKYLELVSKDIESQFPEFLDCGYVTVARKGWKCVNCLEWQKPGVCVSMDGYQFEEPDYLELSCTLCHASALCRSYSTDEVVIVRPDVKRLPSYKPPVEKFEQAKFDMEKLKKRKPTPKVERKKRIMIVFKKMSEQ